MSAYIHWVQSNPIFSAMVQFAILGTLGDMVGKWLAERKVFLPFTIPVLLLKMAEWAFLAVLIKYAFVGFHGFVAELVAHHMIPEMGLLGSSFMISLTMNLQFGLFLVIMHRVLDNLIAGEWQWKNLNKGFYSLLWFWIPAHTVTFTLPRPFQIGLAALWSVVLGVILGYYNRSRK